MPVPGDTAPVKGLHLKPLIALQQDGFDLAVLLAMERDLLQRTHRWMLLGSRPVTREDLVAQTLQDMPQGTRLLKLYNETAATLACRPVQELETIASTLASCARSLEAAAVRHLARGETLNVAEKAQAHHTIGQWLADLLQAAETLGQTGVIAAAGNARRLQTISDFVHSGPLAKFADKAHAVLSMRASIEDDADTQRMALTA